MGDSLVTALILAAVALSESVRRLSPGAFVLRRNAFGPWKLARTFEIGTGLHLLALCVPYTLPVVLPPVDSGKPIPLGVGREVRRLKARSRRAEIDLLVLRVVGLLVLVMLVLGLPFAVSRWSGWGLILSVQLLLVLTLTQATIVALALMRVAGGVGWRAALSSSLRYVWPFSAPQAALLLQERIVTGVPPLVVAHTLLGEDEFLRSLRPFVYDTHRDGATSDDGRALLLLCDAPSLKAFLRRPPSLGMTDPFCPRCAMVYRAGVLECSDCHGVALETSPAV